MFKCDKCKEDFDNQISLNNHKRFHQKYDKIKDDIINDYVNNHLTYRELTSKYDANPTSLSKILKDVDVDVVDKKRKRGTLIHKHTDETKEKISKIRRKWLEENKDKHVWKRHDKFISKPCEYLKDKLIENGITFLPEYTLDPETTDNYKNYAIDIAFPNVKIGLEVNGNQHYNADNTLKKYYQEKNDYFIKNGWTIYQIYYIKVYNKLFVNDLIQKLKNNYDIGNVDYSFYIRKKKEYFCKTCGENKVKKKDVDCLNCSRFKRRKVKNRPNRDELNKLVDDYGMEYVGRKFGVTGAAVKKWLKNEKIMTFNYFNFKNKNKLW